MWPLAERSFLKNDGPRSTSAASTAGRMRCGQRKQSQRGEDPLVMAMEDL
jgi:hypothetical protein